MRKIRIPNGIPSDFCIQSLVFVLVSGFQLRVFPLMIYTARQLQDLHKGNANGQLVLPYGARLTPLALDWAKAKKITVGDSDIESPKPRPIATPEPKNAPPGSPSMLWWCHGPYGTAKASITPQCNK